MNFLYPLILLAFCCIFTLETQASVTTTATPPANRGDRELAIDINEAADDNYLTAFEEALRLDLDTIGLSIDWNDIETSPNEYDTDLLSVINEFYPAYNIPITLTIRPIHTTQDVRPTDLQSLDLDNITVMSRFETLLDVMNTAMPNVRYAAIIIGSEIDIYLGQNSDQWNDWNTFFTAAVSAAKNDFGNEVPMSSEVTREAIFDHPPSRSIWFDGLVTSNADFMAISYYHHLGAAGDFQIDNVPLTTRITDALDLLDGSGEYAGANWPVRLTQFGMPSSELLNSSEQKQAAFIAESFDIWDATPRIVQIDFTWMHDRSRASAENFAELDGGTGNEQLIEFLASLGLRHRAVSGVDKPAWLQLMHEARARGWHSTQDSEFSILDVSFNVNPNSSETQMFIEGEALPSSTETLNHRINISNGSGNTSMSGASEFRQTNETLNITVSPTP